MKKKFLVVTMIIGIGFSMCGGFQANAQEAEYEDEFILEEITVTATKRKKNLQTVPISATSVVGEDMLKTGKTTIEQMLQDAAGVELRGSANEAQIYIRGVGSNASGQGVELNVSVSTNGMYSTNNQASRMSSFDVARVEVTRGPDSTLNGRTAAGGAINIITNEPTHSFESTGSITAGNYNLFNTQGVINVPVGEKLALRGAYMTAKRDGYLSNGQSSLDNFGERARVLYEPNDKLKMILTAEYFQAGGKGRAGDAYTTPIDLSEPFTTPRGDFYSPVEAPDFSECVNDNYYLDITYDLGWATLFVQPTHQFSDFDYANYSQDYDSGSTDDTADTWSAIFTKGTQEIDSFEVRLTSPDDGKLTWLAGYYFLDFQELTAFSMAMNETSMPAVQYLEIVESSGRRDTVDNALYAQVAYSLSDTLSISFGGRYTEDDKSRPYEEGNSLYYYLDDGLDNSTTGEIVYYTTPEETITTERWDYKMTVQKNLSSDTMIYVLISTGFKGGGFNNLPSDSSLWTAGYSSFYGPEYLTSYEIGTKSQLMQNTLRLNTSAFYYDYEDIQLNFSGHPFATSTGVDPDFTKAVIQNGGTATTYGVEIEADWLVARHDRVGLNIAYLHAEFDEMAFEPLYYLEGTEMPQSPSWRISPSYQHTFDLDLNGELMAEIDGTYVSDAIYQIPNQTVSPYNTRDAYFKANATLSYYSQNGRWSLSGYIRNILDEQTYDSITQPTVYSGYDNITFKPSAPRTFGITLSANF